MWNRGGFRSAALERAKAQLSGQRINTSRTPKTNAQRDMGGANLAKGRQTPLQRLSDLSSEDAESEDYNHPAEAAKVAPRSAEPLEQFGMGGGSRFLKKSASGAAAEGQLSAPSRTPADSRDFRLVPQRSSQSVALSRLALIEDRLRSHKSRKPGPDLGTDPPLPQESGVSAQSSSDLSMTGSRFLKKKASAAADQKIHDSTITRGSYKAPPRVASQMEKSLDSDEEDIRRLLGESLDSPDGSLTKVLRQSPQIPSKTDMKSGVKVSSPSVPSAEKLQEKPPVSSAFTAHRHRSPSLSPPSSPKVPSASRPGSRRAAVTPLSVNSSSGHSEIRSLEELFPVESKDDDTLSERSVASDDFKFNVITLDDLAPGTFGTAQLSNEKTEASPTGFRELSPLPADKISHKDGRRPAEAPAEYESDFESEIQTETALSANEISEHFSGGGPATEPQSRSDDSYTEGDHSLSEDPSQSRSIRYSKSESSLSRSRSAYSSSYSSDATVTQSEPWSPSYRRPTKDAMVQTQRDGLTYAWSSGQAVLGPSVGMSYVDPTPVASHVISAEAVEALSAYSPAVFALNDMLRQQLALTRSFIESSRHLHQTMVESLGPADYRYTTLEETKEFIHCNRPPKLSMEEALEEVLREMREYHYI